MKLEAGDGPRSWSVLSMKKGSVSGSPAAEITDRIHFPSEFTRKTRGIMTPGTILLATADASNENTVSRRDFGIIQPDKQ